MLELIGWSILAIIMVCWFLSSLAGLSAFGVIAVLLVLILFKN